MDFGYGGMGLGWNWDAGNGQGEMGVFIARLQYHSRMGRDGSFVFPLALFILGLSFLLSYNDVPDFTTYAPSPPRKKEVYPSYRICAKSQPVLPFLKCFLPTQKFMYTYHDQSVC